jgi:hypothetical protein
VIVVGVVLVVVVGFAWGVLRRGHAAERCGAVGEVQVVRQARERRTGPGLFRGSRGMM